MFVDECFQWLAHPKPEARTTEIQEYATCAWAFPLKARFWSLAQPRTVTAVLDNMPDRVRAQNAFRKPDSVQQEPENLHNPAGILGPYGLPSMYD